MGTRLGIIGGGQLGGFLCQAAKSIGIDTAVLSKRPEGLVVSYADRLIDASFNDMAALDALLDCSDVITFELEDVPLEALEKLAHQERVRVYPRPETMRLIQNKGLQKDWLAEHGFPTSPHIRFDNGFCAEKAIDLLGQNFVIKTQRGGYDGLGVKVVKNGQIPQGYEDVPTIAEGLVQDFVEIALLVARDADGNIVPFPLFQSSFDERGNVVRRVTCPASVSAKVEKEATQLGCEIVEALDGVGVFAIEYFLSGDTLLVKRDRATRTQCGSSDDRSQYCLSVRATCSCGHVDAYGSGQGGTCRDGESPVRTRDRQGLRKRNRLSGNAECGGSLVWQAYAQTATQDGTPHGDFRKRCRSRIVSG